MDGYSFVIQIRIFPMLAVHLRDINAGIVKAWEQAFADVPEVHVSRGDIFEHKADAIVSPANSFGFMDGGIDCIRSILGGTFKQPCKLCSRSSTMANCRSGKPS
jgi:hypothetical protein